MKNIKPIVEFIKQYYLSTNQEKLAFNIINGGWEKALEIDLGFHLLKEKMKEGGWVKMQDKRVDINIYDDSKQSEYIIEIGHYTLNQGLMKASEFKPITDIDKREKQGFSDVIHIQQIEYVNTSDLFKYFKYGLKKKAKLSQYLEMYDNNNLSYSLVKHNVKELGYEIESAIIVSQRKADD